MADQGTIARSVVAHGAASLPEVEVDSYNVELKDDEGLLGDRANKGAFRAILERWRKPLRMAGDDPFGDEASENISRKKLDALLSAGNPEAAGVVQGAIEDFAQELALVIRRFLKLRPGAILKESPWVAASAPAGSANSPSVARQSS
jgi:hypothetical protein